MSKVGRPWDREDTFYVTDERSKDVCSYLSSSERFCNKLATHLGHWGPRCEQHRDQRWSAKVEALQQIKRAGWVPA